MCLMTLNAAQVCIWCNEEIVDGWVCVGVRCVSERVREMDTTFFFKQVLCKIVLCLV